jgi:hypothetical protein
MGILFSQCKPIEMILLLCDVDIVDIIGTTSSDLREVFIVHCHTVKVYLV